MYHCASNGDKIIQTDPRQRLEPVLPTPSTSLLALNHSPDTGFGVFSSQQLPANTALLESNIPAVYMIYRAFRKEVCAWCFRYEQGRNWKIRFASAVDGNGGSGWAGMAFCCEECRDAWKDAYGECGLEAYAAVEAFLHKQARSKGWWMAEASPVDDDRLPTEAEIEEAWKSTEEQANLLRTLRLETSAGAFYNTHSSPHTNPSAKIRKPTKAENHALAQATALPILNTDTLFFLLSGILCAASSTSEGHWRALLMLNPSLNVVYTSMGSLRQVTSTFLHLCAILPSSLLPYVNRETLEAVLARDIGNSFGIWSTNTESGSEIQDEGAEMLGYGIWPVASFFNHSCVPNVSRHRVGRRWIFTAARNVANNEELCISYIRGEEDMLSVYERRGRLKDAWGFICRCQKCVSEDESKIELA